MSSLSREPPAPRNPAHPSGLFAPVPAVVGHRGAPLQHRENTPDAFAAAAAQGATWVELDVRLTGDGEAVVHHDPVLGDGRALIDLDVAACRGAGVWTLAEVLAALPDGLGVDLEIKNLPGEPDHDDSMRVVARTAAVLAADPRVAGRPRALTSFNPMVLLAAGERGLELPRGLLTFAVPLEAGIEAAVELGCDAVCPFDDTEGLDGDGIAAAHDAGLALLVWTVDEADRIRDLADAGADAICTNDPAGAVAALAAGPPAGRRSG